MIKTPLIETKHNVTHKVHSESEFPLEDLHLNGGASSGMAGDDVLFLDCKDRHADVTGCANCTVTDISLATVAGSVQSMTGPVIWIVNQCTSHGEGKTTHSIVQIDDFDNEVDKRPLNSKEILVDNASSCAMDAFSLCKFGMAHLRS